MRRINLRWLRVAALFVVLALLAVACRSTTVMVESATLAPSPEAVADPPATAMPTATAVPTAISKPVPTPEPTATAAPTSTPEPTATAAPTSEPTPEPTVTAAPTSEPTPEPTATAAPTSEPTPEPSPTVAAEPEPEATAQPDEPVEITTEDLVALSSLRSVQCPSAVAAAQVSCSVATIPRNLDDPEPGDNVEIMVARVDNGNPNGIGPVVFLQGGPGVGSVGQAKFFVGGSHDVLFVDQRGTGYSTPRLDCPEVDELWEAQFSDDPDVRLADTALTGAYATCGRRLQNAGIDFDQFNTRSAATDIELIRQLFQYEQWSIWGISYGTRLGLTLMRDHPDGIRAAVLDSVVPFEIDFFATIPENAIRAITALDEACDDTQCAEDHGDFLSTLSELVVELDENPVVVTAIRPANGNEFPFRVDGEMLIDLVFTQLYSTQSLLALPRQIDRAGLGGVNELVAAFVTGRDPTQFDLSVGLYYTTWCREEFPFYDESTDDQLLQDLEADFGTAVADALSNDGIGRFCDIFDVEPAPLDEDQPISSPIPTLVFAGAFDPITPPAWSQQVADALPNSTYVEMANHGHGMATQCPVSIRVQFLIDPLSDVDTSCADQTGGPEFQ